MQIYPLFLPYAGCPHRCRFCRQAESELPTPGEIETFLEGVLPAAGGGEIAFYGGTFTLLPVPLQEAYLRSVAPFLAAGRVAGIRLSTRPDALPVATVERLRALRVTTVEIGCQSFSTMVLDHCGRGHGPLGVTAAVARLRRAGLRVGLQLMPGLPGGDRAEAVASLHAALDLHPDFLRIYPAVVFRGTELERDWRVGEYNPLSLSEAVDWCAEMLWLCRRAGVPVVRTGLQGTPDLERELVAGPWHPAFGQLVRSRLWLRALRRTAAGTGSLLAEVAPADLGDAQGHRRENLAELRGSLGSFTIAARAGLAREQLRVDGQSFDLWNMANY